MDADNVEQCFQPVRAEGEKRRDETNAEIFREYVLNANELSFPQFNSIIEPDLGTQFALTTYSRNLQGLDCICPTPPVNLASKM